MKKVDWRKRLRAVQTDPDCFKVCFPTYPAGETCCVDIRHHAKCVKHLFNHYCPVEVLRRDGTRYRFIGLLGEVYPFPWNNLSALAFRNITQRRELP
jgi:hypothetical protein